MLEVKNSIAPGGSSHFLPRPLIVLVGKPNVFVGGWKGDGRFEKVLEGETRSLGDEKLVLLEERGEITLRVVENGLIWDIGRPANGEGTEGKQPRKRRRGSGRKEEPGWEKGDRERRRDYAGFWGGDDGGRYFR